jgi:hypothetical protein
LKQDGQDDGFTKELLENYDTMNKMPDDEYKSVSCVIVKLTLRKALQLIRENTMLRIGLLCNK